MAESFLKLDKRRALKSEKYPIQIAVGSGTNLYISTGIAASADEWDDRTKTFVGKNAKSINLALDRMRASVMARMVELRSCGLLAKLSRKQLKAMLEDMDAAAPPMEVRTIEEMFNGMMQAKGGRTAQIYASTLKRVALYRDPAKEGFDAIDTAWLDGFCASMSGLSPNTKSLHLRNLRAVNNYALQCGACTAYPFKHYRLPRQTMRKRALSAQIIARIADLPLGRGGEYRDMFMLTFYLIGINFIDLCNAKGVDADGRIRYERAKTHKPYSIKAEPEALAIIDRLKGESHLVRVLETHKDYRNYYRQLRRGLAKVVEEYNKHYPKEPIAELTTYHARHSWATIAASLDIPKETVAQGLGHELGNDMTSIYIDFDRSKVDRANRKVINAVMAKRGK